MKVRQDAWTEEDDLLLAETVLRHVREGSTQLNAFEEVGDKLNRTSAACGFRWNAVVRHNYDKALSLAKKQRKQRQRILGKDQGGKKRLLYTPPSPTISDIMVPHVQEEELELKSEVDTTNYEAAEEFVVAEALAPKTQHTPVTLETAMSLDAVIAYLESMNGRMLQAEVLKTENERLKLEIKGLKKRNEDLENKISHLEQNSGLMQEDYETLMNIMNRARKLVLLEEEERPATKFKMDRNGNLEKMAE
ncbi:RsfA family transcriptional regulator [Peribacillus castrilensis]|jgi:prespore-specific regulator|uniref:RsfA family transcriptional regulator n=2 Tax=Peribacillus TaxID=2675229 RepID=A0AAJ1VES4_9BACI|nr:MULTISPECIES: RsfA family transcriptional regulator [Peribacillus]MCD1160675.1 RsfA family transcriptional regulator [Peribacillus castrilensis]TDL87296.1 RsfA family transcriptional regulator [Vibrio vulnificus]MDM5287170.1 RsfA family transcriptional regulator [Peribacillus frigoritolerans]MDR4928970.1 RsfA family transcriptional regulator [Peribacillus simplex]MEB2627251.1 RsfA family transcriptional regulator [Peribacillus frigoritolerans]